MKKPDMVAAAEVQLAGTGWLPEPLRTPGRLFVPAEGEPVDRRDRLRSRQVDTVSTDTVEESAAIDGEQAIDDIDADDETDDVHLPAHALAAE